MPCISVFNFCVLPVSVTSVFLLFSFTLFLFHQEKISLETEPQSSRSLLFSTAPARFSLKPSHRTYSLFVEYVPRTGYFYREKTIEEVLTRRMLLKKMWRGGVASLEHASWFIILIEGLIREITWGEDQDESVCTRSMKEEKSKL